MSLTLTSRQYIDALSYPNTEAVKASGAGNDHYAELKGAYDPWHELHIDTPTRALQHPSRKMRGGDRVMLFNGPRDGGISAEDSYKKAQALENSAHPAPEGLSEVALAYLTLAVKALVK